MVGDTYSVQISGPPETHRVLPEYEHESLLQEWVDKLGPPNDAELLMLEEYLRVDVYVIYDWCKSSCLENVKQIADTHTVKARNLQIRAINLMMGEAFSKNKAWRKIGFLRYLALRRQTTWLRVLARLRAKAKKTRENGAEGGPRGKKRKANVTLEDVRGEMKPYICEEMD